jgi:hypothetical protein
MSADIKMMCRRAALWVGVGLLAATVACGGGQAAPASSATHQPTADPAVAAYKATVRLEQAALSVAYGNVKSNCTLQIGGPSGQYVPDLEHCIPAMDSLAATARKMKGDLGATSVPLTLATANATLVVDLTNLVAAVVAAGAQISALGENYGGATCCFFNPDVGGNPAFLQEAADAKVVTG